MAGAAAKGWSAANAGSAQSAMAIAMEDFHHGTT
jgi:hypothetical protein